MFGNIAKKAGDVLKQNTSGAPKNKSAPNPNVTVVRRIDSPTAIDVTPQYEMQKKLAEQGLNKQAQGQREAMQRRFAQLGGGPSGAAIKSEQNLEAQLGEQRQQALTGIEMSKLQAQQEENKRISDLAFQNEMAQRGLEYQAGESALGRALQERGMSNQAKQAAAQMAFARQQAEWDRIDQAFNKAVSLGQMSQSQANAFKEYLKQFGGGSIDTVVSSRGNTKGLY